MPDHTTDAEPPQGHTAADLAIAERLKQGAPELSASLDAWIRNVGVQGSRAASIEVLLSRLIREARAALNEEKAELAVVLATPHDEAVLILNGNGVITGVCKHSSEILGVNPETLIGRTIDAFLTKPYEGIEETATEMAQAAKGERVHSSRTQRREDGTTFVSSHTVVALIGVLGEISGFARSIEDVSQRRLHEIHIEDLNASVALLISEQR